ncbi:MAG: radical SAM protein [Planctomycetia bacterium]|nr:radical SAM protein [Planctomycetia bacterium]
MAELIPGTSHFELYKHHDRFWKDYEYVYPVLSRRSQGISVGININPDGNCNFHCVYCQVDPEKTRKGSVICLEKLREELETCVTWAVRGDIFSHEIFRNVPPELRRVNDVAFSGDGEPTICPLFEEAVHVVTQVRRKLVEHGENEVIRRAAEEMKLVLITNSTQFRKPKIREILSDFRKNHGEIWAKLDAGTEAYYKKINRSGVPFHEILAGITEVARQQPVVIQTLFCLYEGAPSEEELRAYIERIREITAAGGMIDYIQLHSVCRRTAEASCQQIPPEELKCIGQEIFNRTDVKVEVF